MSPRRRLLALVGTALVVLFVLAFVYMVGMSRLEGEPRTFIQSLEWAAETLSSTGYGADSQWNHPAMAMFVIVVQLVGMSLAFLVIPVYVMPYFEARFEVKLPRVSPKLNDAVLLYRWGPAVATLADELDRAHTQVVVLEEDEGVARRLVDRGRSVVYGSFAEEADLDASTVAGARAVVLNGSDHENGAMVLALRQLGFAGEILALVDNPLHRRPMALAGASATYTPRHVLAAALAALAGQRTTARVAGVQHLGGRLAVAELRVHRGSELMGKTLAEADIRRKTRATVVGLWRGGEFVAHPRADTRLDAGAILVAVGGQAALDRFAELARPLVSDGPVVVVGYGEVGFKVAQLLRDSDERVVTIDRNPGDGVDVAGDALDPSVLRKAGVTTARAVVLAMGGDSAILFAASVVRDLAPEVPIIARVDRVENIERIHRAGADFARALGQVAGEILAHQLLGDEWLAMEARVKLVAVGPAGLVGSNPAEARVGQRTGCTIVALRRDDEVIADLDDDLEIRDGDRLYLCGTEDAVARYHAEFRGSQLDD
jgi:Trk K+ transport system NAD-binding subunit